MVRSGRSSTVFFRLESGKERHDVFLRINPTAIRYSQAKKGGTVDTIGGYFREVLQATNPQHSGLMLPELTIEGTTGAAYRKELDNLIWIWHKSVEISKETGKPADCYFFDTTKTPDYQGIVRAADYGYLIDLRNFACDDSASKRGEITFTFRCKILKDLFWNKVMPPGVKTTPLPVREKVAS